MQAGIKGGAERGDSQTTPYSNTTSALCSGGTSAMRNETLNLHKKEAKCDLPSNGLYD